MTSLGSKMITEEVRLLIKTALKEDMPFSDISATLFSDKDIKTFFLISKGDGVLCGIEIFKETFLCLDESITFESKHEDGDKIKKGDLILKVTGKVKHILSGERTALNFLGKLSGISTKTYNLAKFLDGTKIKLVDTRKTTPLLRSIEKYAVRIGGGHNHRFSLSDMLMIKDNHIASCGGIEKAVALARQNISFAHKIEVECENMAMVKEALNSGVDIIMLDNMDTQTMREAIKLIRNTNTTIEVSGNINEERIKELRSLDIDIISSGAIIHSAPCFDFSLKWKDKI